MKLMAKQKHLINREISWLHFNQRVLQEAMDPKNPLIERFKFLGIFSSNRDEFFRVRIATLRRLILVENTKSNKIEYNAKKLLKEILAIVEAQEKEYTQTFLDIRDELKKKNIVFLDENNLDKEQGIFVQQFFNSEVRPFLFPIMLKNLESPDAEGD